MSIFICAGHDWRSDKGRVCPTCLEKGFVSMRDDETELPVKAEFKDGTIRYAKNPNWLPLGEELDMVVEGSLEFLEKEDEG